MPDLTVEAPAKVNLSLLVSAGDASGYHPLRSLVQTVEWCDLLEIDEADEEVLVVEDADLPDDDENLVWRAIRAATDRRPRLALHLRKRIPVAAGLAGGSSDAAAALLALGELAGLTEDAMHRVAPEVGADVRYFLTGGTAWMEGYGERISAADRLDGFALAIAVPGFELATPEVYRRWDRLDGPTGPEFPARYLPPVLRREEGMRNDLTPAALAVRPELGDWIADVSARWDRPVAMSGSGPAVFGYFADLDEARSAAVDAAPEARAACGVDLRPRGVCLVD
jgi:4-diphosphocytidyl-2-C-methyl-D-erythritol kinase